MEESATYDWPGSPKSAPLNPQSGPERTGMIGVSEMLSFLLVRWAGAYKIDLGWVTSPCILLEQVTCTHFDGGQCSRSCFKYDRE